MSNWYPQSVRSLGILLGVWGTFWLSGATAAPPHFAEVAKQVDQAIEAELQAASLPPAGLIRDEDYLRRVTFDLTGRIPTPAAMTEFGLNPDPLKRSQKVETLLEDEDFAYNWSAYWRDVIFMRATEQRARAFQGAFQIWMRDQLAENRPWNEITTELLTATGDVRENGATGLMFAHSGEATELAAEATRIFLGIQIQCANCHDHPTDTWTRSQFHEMAAYFPRVRVVQKIQDTPPTFEVNSFNVQRGGGRDFFDNPETMLRFVDRNRDGKIDPEEAKMNPRFGMLFERILSVGDTDQDGKISLEELKTLPRPEGNRRGNTEYFMPDLEDPAAEGTRKDPVFFLDEKAAAKGLSDVDRRAALARSITSPDNIWFARAFVNRIWTELVGTSFYAMVDDMGPLREARQEEALTLLSDGFVASGYDIKWLFRTITATRTYQRELSNGTLVDEPVEFACATPTRFRSEQILSALMAIAGRPDEGREITVGRRGNFAGQRMGNITELFSFDPSTPQEDLSGDIPQSLFMMNSPLIGQLVSARGTGPLASLLRRYDQDEDALRELYVLVLTREPSNSEMDVLKRYLYEVDNRADAFEDVMWSLVNSTEFLYRR